MPENKPLNKEILRKVSEGVDVSRLVHPICANCLAIKRIDASLNEKMTEILRVKPLS